VQTTGTKHHGWLDAPLPIAGRRDVVVLTLTVLLLWRFLSASGGFYERSWGMALVVCFSSAVALVLLRGVSLTRTERTFIGGLFLFAAWSALSGVWTASIPSTLEDLQRNAVYPAAMLAVVLVRPARSIVCGGVVGAVLAVAALPLLRRFAPDVFGSGPLGADRLAGPIGYPDGLGVVAAVALLLTSGGCVAWQGPRLSRS
jgi:hypothetical protein